MSRILPYFILLPMLGAGLGFCMNRKNEKLIFSISITTICIHVLALLLFTSLWIKNGFRELFYQGPTLYHSGSAKFAVEFYFDGTSAVYLLVAGVIAFLANIFSRYYMHRDKGFKRFFNNVLFFYLGLNFVVLAGNFETLFIGWEILGITSFFLIAFYRDRYLPVKNALKVVSLYRIADVCLLLGIWACHHYFEKSISFPELKNISAGHLETSGESYFLFLIPFIFLVAALVKSAQFPFSSWLPRAMEGPTVSSAIFYGSLSVHIGVFLMIRTYPLWENSILLKMIVMGFGILTSLVASGIASVQSTVKTQIAYASIAQIGLMFAEVALGFHALALIHFTCNAFLRTYQLLVSPSVLSYLVHDQFFHFIPPQHNIKDSFLGRIKLTLFVLSIKEWNLDTWMYRFLWSPAKRIGNIFHFITIKSVVFLFGPLYLAGLYFVYHKDVVPAGVMSILPVVLGAIGLIMALKAFTERDNAGSAWIMIVLNQLYAALSIAFNEQFDHTQVHIFLSGIFVSGVVGFICIGNLKRSGEQISLDRFHGYAYKHSLLSFVFLLACLGLAGFPITPTFVGEDILFSHIHHNQFGLIALTSLSLIIDGIAILRIFARLFWGPYMETYHEVAYKSS